LNRFELVSPFSPQGDQPAAIDQLAEGLERGDKEQVLLGVTGSGKTFSIAKVVERVNRPTLVLSHNKTLAAQLFQEFRSFFPHNAVEYFVSYYDYYQPEAYVPQSDTYIEKETNINEEIDRLRLRATKALFERRDVLLVASVSCIYGLGSPEAFFGMLEFFEKGSQTGMDRALARLVAMQYQRTSLDLFHGSFRVRGDVLEVLPAYEDNALRIEYFGDEIERITRFDTLRGDAIEALDRVAVFPRTHYVTPKENLERAIGSIQRELRERLDELEAEGKLLERQRLEQRTRFDLEMLKETGYCHGIENYSRHLSGRAAGEPPPTLLDYFPQDFLLIADESHQTIPQVRGMYHGDRSRKQTLVDFGFRLPSALDNRPLTFEEFDARIGQRIYVSATPAPWELERVGGVVAEQLIRPTGLLDPEIEIRPAKGQVDDLLMRIREVAARGERVLVTTLTKKMAEELTQYLMECGVRVRYLHSDVPEVSLVAILDADKEGFLRSETALIQTAGRAARNLNGKVVLYADVETNSIRRTVAETKRRRIRQETYNREHGIEPRTILKDIHSPLVAMSNLDYSANLSPRLLEVADGPEVPLAQRIARVEKEMKAAAKRLEFEEAAILRDRLKELRELQIYAG
jgi:excinuclease ABC subunit B